MAEAQLIFGPLGGSALHLCVDMQRMFAEDTEWHTPWMSRVLPRVVALAAARPERTLFTRFIPAARPGDGRGTWARYSARWASMTRQRLHPELLGLVPDLQRFVAPANVLDKQVYSPWPGTGLDKRLAQQGIDTLIVSGCETDVCVLATVLGAVDFGYRVVLATDALCSSSDEAHESALDLYRRRYGTQVETVPVATILEAWT